MGTILIDKLLSAQVKQGASDLHITVGQPPVLRPTWSAAKAEDQGAGSRRHDGADEKHHTRPLPTGISRNGQHRLRIRLWRPGAVPRIGVSTTRKRGDCVATDSGRHDDHGGSGRPLDFQRNGDAPSRARTGDGAHGIGQEYVAGRDGRLHQRNGRPPHYHDRRSDRVLPQSQEIDRQPARSGRRRNLVCRGDSTRAAARPRRDSGR